MSPYTVLASILVFSTPTIAGFDEYGNWCDEGSVYEYDYTEAPDYLVTPYNTWNINLDPYKDMEKSMKRMQREVDWSNRDQNIFLQQ